MKVPTNRASDIIKYYVAKLSKNYTEPESKSLIYQLLKYHFKIEKLDLVKNPEQRLSESELLKIHFSVRDLLANKPIQYIIGETDFMGLRIEVNPSVLIPRPETEELVQLMLDTESLNNSKARILDIGTGSGCIAISIKSKCRELEVCGLDVSIEALEVARRNADLNNCEIKFIHADILDENGWPQIGNFNFMISNPPYVRASDKALMHKNVLDFEPEGALFVADADPLIFYRKIAAFAKEHLKRNGVLYFEINEKLGGEIQDLLSSMNYRLVEVIKDVYEKDRFIRALK